MRKLAMLIIAIVLVSALPAKAAEADQTNTPDAIQTLETKKITSLSDNFLTAAYITSTSMKFKSRLQSENIVVPRGSFTINASAYTAAADECGKSDGITASGARVQANHTLACPKAYKMGTKIDIEGMGTYVCEDRGGAIKGNHFDIYMPTKKQAFAFGRRNLIANVIE